MNFVRIGAIFSVLAVSFFGFSHIAVAQEVEEAALPICYAQSESGKTINLASLCGGGTSSYNQQNHYVGGYSSNSYPGNCQYSSQVDSSGKTCGDRSDSYSPSDQRRHRGRRHSGN